MKKIQLIYNFETKTFEFGSAFNGFGIFQDERSALDLDTVFSSKTKLTYVITDWISGKPYYVQPTKEKIFRQMSASCALPFVHSPILIDGVFYRDGGFSDPMPLQKAIDDDNDEIIVVFNSSKGYYKSFKKKINDCGSLFLYHPSKSAELWRRLNRLESELIKCPKVKIIRSFSEIPLKSKLETNKRKINQTFDMGVESAYKFLSENNF